MHAAQQQHVISAPWQSYTHAYDQLCLLACLQAEGYDNQYNTVGATGLGATDATGLGATSVSTSTTSGYQEGIVERPVGVGVAEVPVVVTEQV